MASYPQHPLILHIANYISTNIHNRYYGVHSLDITGPMAVGKAINTFLNRNETDSFEPSILRYHSYKIKILPFLIDHSIFYNNRKHYIMNNHGEKCILTKFDNYYHIMYGSRNTPHYGKYWNNNDVYHN
jgi:hypothetical protein